MEPKDRAYKVFCNFFDNLTPAYWEGVTTEADVRMKVIDKVFINILGWPDNEIFLENKAGAGFIDYRLTINGLNRLIIEAKRESRDLGIDDSHGGRYFKINGSVFNTEAAKEGIEQSIYYCGHKGAELACVTNGREWIIFRGNRLGDGLDIAEGKACCFGSLAQVKENFSLFYDLLSYESVGRNLFRPRFIEAEGQPIRTNIFRESARRSESRNLLPADKIYNDISRIMLSFFQDLSGEDDPEGRKACFVTTHESASVEENLLRISEDLRNKAREISTHQGEELTEAIRRVQEMNRREMILLVGTKGAGKTTFIDRFFSDILPDDIAGDCVVIRVDVSKSGCDADSIIKWLDQHFLDEAERAAFGKNAPTWDDYVGMYFKEYQRWSEGTHKHLYETNKDQFKIDFGRHIENRRETRPHEYIVHLLHRIVAGIKKVPCIVFDNADHFDVRFQEEVFNFAHSLYKECLCMIILPITDTTSWQLAKQGAMQSFYTESFFLPTPPTELILRRRIEYLEKKVEKEKPESGTGYFVGRGINLAFENIRKFTACLQTVFLKTERVADWIGRLSNHDIRRSLQLTREIMSSPHIPIQDLLNSYLAKTDMKILSEDIKLALIKGKYDICFSTNNSFIQNIFNLVPATTTTPLLGLRILTFLIDQWEQNRENDSRYVSPKTIIEYFDAVGISSHVVMAWLEQMLQTGLILSYDPTQKNINLDVRVEISPSGRQHLTWGISDWVYLESMAEITPLLCRDTYQEINALLADKDAHGRRETIKKFISYLIKEDSYFCKVPSNDRYLPQKEFTRPLSLQLEKLSATEEVASRSRYYRSFGKITIWHSDTAMGYIQPNFGGNLILVHKKDILNANDQDPPSKVRVEYDLADGPKRDRAKKVVMHN